MATKTLLESPAGEPIEIVEDRVWIDLTGASATGLRQFGPTNRKVWLMRALYEHGEFSDKSGRATKVLDDYCRANYPDYPVEEKAHSSITSLWTHPMTVPAVERKMNGKRTFAIKLVALPQSWFMKMAKNQVDYDYTPEPEPEPEPIEPEPEQPTEADRAEALAAEERLTDNDIQRLLDEVPGVDAPSLFEALPSLDLSIATQVAMSLLTTCVEIITAGSSAAIDDRVRKLQGDFTEVSQRLSQRLTENDSLRRQLRQAGDEIRALRVERDGLRSRLRATEANLTAALKGDAINAINGEIQRRVDSIMRVTPTTKGDD